MTENNDKIKQLREAIARRLEYCNIVKISEQLKINRKTLAKMKDPYKGNIHLSTLVKVSDFFKIEIGQA